MKHLQKFRSLEAAREALRAYRPRPLSSARARQLFAGPTRPDRRYEPGLYRFSSWAEAQQHALTSMIRRSIGS